MHNICTDYCFNCGYWSLLVNHVYCKSCLDYWHTHSRFPRKGETS